MAAPQHRSLSASTRPLTRANLATSCWSWGGAEHQVEPAAQFVELPLQRERFGVVRLTARMEVCPNTEPVVPVHHLMTVVDNTTDGGRFALKSVTILFDCPCGAG